MEKNHPEKKAQEGTSNFENSKTKDNELNS